MAFTSVPVTGTIKHPDGTLAAGAQVSFTLNVGISDGTNYVSPEAITETCDGSGNFTASLYANDDTTTTPQGTFYSVKITAANKPWVTLDTFNIIVPKADVAGVSLLSLATLLNPESVSPFVSQIIAGTGVTLTPSSGTGSVRIDASGGGGGSSLAPTAVKTANYTAVASDFVPCDVSAGGFTVTLPTTPADKTQVAVKIVKQATAPNTLTLAAGGTDVFNVAGGSTTLAVTALFEANTLQYKASTGIWYVVSTDTPVAPTGQEFINVLATPFSNVRWNTIAQSSLDYFGGELQSDSSQNAEVVFQKYLQAGTYTMDLFYKTGASHGIFTIFVDGVQLGTTVDSWVASGGAMLRATIAGIVISGSTVHAIRLLMATKNASATSYFGITGGISMTRTGS